MINEHQSQFLWQPSQERIDNANITHFKNALNGRWNASLNNYDDLHQFSLKSPDQCWKSFWEYAGIYPDYNDSITIQSSDKFWQNLYFPNAEINYAENLLRLNDESPAIIFQVEDYFKKSITWQSLQEQVAQMSSALQNAGVKKGDVVAACTPNCPEAIIAVLATASIGAIWTSCSPDFGLQSITDRFGQTKPVFLFAAISYRYNGKTFNLYDKIITLKDALPSLRSIILFDMFEPTNTFDDGPLPSNIIAWSEFINQYAPGNWKNTKPTFERFSFNHPLFIMSSSGTTGLPKCIVHGAGGVLLKQMSELILNCNIKAHDRLFYFTTCSWMMWNWLIMGLACKATLLLYDGSPFYPSPDVLFNFAQENKATHFGTSAKYIDSLKKAGYRAKDQHDLLSLHTMLSTGSPLVAESFEYVYEHIKSDLHLASISGGTDLMGCFVAGNPIAPVYGGQIQVPTLGMDVQIWSDEGHSIKSQKGELVCAQPFPSMPIHFWNDHDGKGYFQSYFSKFENIWCHGDFAEQTQEGGYIIYGRSDTTLNPGGIRIGTAEIYRQVESFDAIAECIAVDQEWQNDTRIILFVRMHNAKLTPTLKKQITDRLSKQCSLRHVPAKIIEVTDIPRTKSGKITERSVHNIIHHRAVLNANSLANPEALEQYKNLIELET